MKDGHKNGLLVLAVAALWAVFPLEAQERYGFEPGTQGWQVTTFSGSQAISSVARSPNQKFAGTYSLMLNTDLRAVSPFSSGEVFVDMLNEPPYAVPIPVDLTGREVSIFVFCPTGSGGPANAPNGLQLIVKDSAFKSEYGTWTPIVENTWIKVALTPSTTVPPQGSMEAGFNPAQIRVVGLKIGAAGNAAAGFRYLGPIYMDSVTFSAPAAPAPSIVNEQYSFNTNSHGFVASTYAQGLAVTNVIRATNIQAAGAGSLRMDVNLIGSNPTRNNGEIFVDMLQAPPYRVETPIDLEGKQLGVYVFCPQGARGNGSAPNAFQLIAKDDQWRSEYGTWTPVVEGYWNQVKLTPSVTAPVNGFVDPGFDPKKIRSLGLKFAAGTNNVSYTGPIYVDIVSFPGAQVPIQNLRYGFETGIEGWQKETFSGITAITSVSPSTATKLTGLNSLMMNVSANSGSTNRVYGAAWVDMTNTPSDLPAPLNLEEKTIEAYVFCPAGTQNANGQNPNQLRLFVKDANFKAEYSTPFTMLDNQWVRVKLTASRTAPPNGFMEAGFDPANIRIIGIDVGISGSYNGPLYLDQVSFPPPNLPNLRYSFEPSKEGWIPETFPGITTVTTVAQSTTFKLDGASSLRMTMNVNTGASTNKVYGATLVDMQNFPPAEVRSPFNLENKYCEAYVYCPQGTQAPTSTNPNQLRLFMKDTNFKTAYGVTSTMLNNKWIRVSLTPSATQAPGTYVEPGFNPQQIRTIGVDVGMIGTYTGYLYLDGVSFPAVVADVPPSNHTYNFNSPTSQDNFPRWTVDPGWGAQAWTSAFLSNGSLAANASFQGAGGIEAKRKGVFNISYNPPLNISTKDHKKIRAKLKFAPPIEGIASFTATISVYDKVTERWYNSKPIGVGTGSWNILDFDLANPASYDPATPGIMAFTDIAGVAIQIYSNVAYTGQVLLDDVVVGGSEIPGTYAPIQGGTVRRQGTKFTLDGSNYYFAGANAEYLFNRSDSVVSQVLDSAAGMNLRSVRTWAFNEGRDYSFQPERGKWNEMAFEHLDRLVAKAGSKNIRLVLALVDNWGHNGGMYQYMNWVAADPSTASSIPPGLQPGSTQFHDEFFVNPYAKQWYKDFVTVLLNRTNTITGRQYKNDPTIMGWEIVNEPRCEVDPSGRRVHDWIKEMSDFVRGIDANHMIACGEEGGYITTYAKANQRAYQDFPQNLWEYGLRGGGAGADFISDNSSTPTLVEWQDGLPEAPGAIHSEVRSACANIDFTTFRLYSDQKEYNLWRTNHNGYDQRKEWMSEHQRDAHNVLGKPVVAEEFGIHSIGWIYNGSFGEFRFHRTPEYSAAERVQLYQLYYDHIEAIGINGSYFWNLGYPEMYENVFNMCESTANWSSDANTDATGLTLDSVNKVEGQYSLKMSYDAARAKGKAFWDLNGLAEKWIVTVANGQPSGVNRVKFTWRVFNPGPTKQMTVAVSTGTQYAWHEAQTQTLATGWNTVTFDLTSGKWKSAASGWQYTGDIANLDDVKKVSVGLFGYSGAGFVCVDDVTVSLDDGFIIYPDDAVVNVIRSHATRMNAK
jgi:hypothetical protein